MPRAGHTFPDRVSDFTSKRLEKLKRIEEAKAPEDRLVSRDWDLEVERKISVLNAVRQRHSKRNFIQLAVCEHVGICETVEQAEAFFTKGGPPFTCGILKLFVEAFVLSSNGNIEEVPTVRTARYLLFGLFSLCKNAGVPIDRDVKRNVMVWVHSDLAVRGLVHHKQRPKAVALPEDFSALLRAFFDTKYLTASQYTTRNALNFVLCANLMLDRSSRIGELTRPSMSNADWEAYKKERKDSLFTWRRVELWAFPGGDGGVELRARMTFSGLKNTGQKGNKVKVIPIRLLPLQMAAEDTLRWLLILGLIDGVFSGISRWADLEAVQSSQHGTKIHIKNSMLDTPVFRQPVHKPTDPSKLLETEVMRSSHFVKQLKELSRHCGLQSPMLPGVLRRGSAYLLGLKTSHEERCARMGHDFKDSTCWGAYRNQTSTVDFQAMRHNLEAVDVSQMLSAFLGKSDAVPNRVSEQGIIEISQDAELRGLLQRECDVIDQIIREFGSFSAARAQRSPKVTEHAAVRRQYQERARALLSKKYKEEYHKHFESLPDTSQIPPSPEPVDGGCDFGNMLLDAADAEDVPIDPALLQDADDMATHLCDMIEGTHLGDVMDADEQSEDVQMDGVLADDGSKRAASLHAAGSASRNAFGLRVMVRNSIFSGLSDLIYKQPEGLSAARFADICVEKFDHLHAADKYYPGQEPTPGTLSCAFCGISLVGKDHNQHIRPCAVNTMAKRILADLDSHQTLHPPNQKCGMIGLDGVSRCASKYKLTRDVKSAAHFTSHCYDCHKDKSSGVYRCNDDGTTFSSWDDFRVHRITQHAASTTILPVDKQTGNPRAEILVFWCKICQQAFSRAAEDEDHHFVQHMDDVQLSVKEHGFAGVFVSNRWFHPSFCIFCLYDGDAGLSTQFADFYTPPAFERHLERHIRDLNDDASIACPAAVNTLNGIRAVCDRTEPMNKKTLVTHLVADHGLVVDRDNTSFKATRKRQRPVLGGKDVNEGLPGVHTSIKKTSKHANHVD